MLPGPEDHFLLFDDARQSGARPARLYARPHAIIRADRLEEVLPALEQLRTAHRQGACLAGTIAYEAGFALEPRLARLMPDKAPTPLLWFGLFDDFAEIAPEAVPGLFADCGKGEIGAVQPQISQDEYARQFARVQEAICAGDIYQANLSFGCDVPVSGDMRGLYASLRAGSRAGHGALVRADGQWLLSLSPELFFTLEAGQIVARPMKGTAPRSPDATADGLAAASLRADAKQRAENLMIVDLLRNDISRVSQSGSVAVPQLFAIESYPTVHQMTSTVTAQLREGLDAIDVLKALFPCGSITGAPKIRAMEIIQAVEQRWRGLYTGAIGYIDPPGRADGRTEFNVAIRTLCFTDGAGQASLGLGSGVVADSQVEAEWMECLDKGRFLGKKSQ